MIIKTTKGDMEEAALKKKIICFDEQDAFVTATEYWFDEELVHRSVNAELKSKNLFSIQAKEI